MIEKLKSPFGLCPSEYEIANKLNEVIDVVNGLSQEILGRDMESQRSKALTIAGSTPAPGNNSEWKIGDKFFRVLFRRDMGYYVPYFSEEIENLEHIITVEKGGCYRTKEEAEAFLTRVKGVM